MVFPNFSADFLLYKHFGVGGEVSWRATRNLSDGFAPFRPIFYDIDAIYAPSLGKRAALELVAGLGGESIRFYQNFVTCGAFSCSNFVSSNHLLGAVGAGIKLYTVHNVFIRPEARFYFIRHNFEFSDNHATRLGVSIGYTFGPIANQDRRGMRDHAHPLRNPMNPGPRHQLALSYLFACHTGLGPTLKMKTDNKPFIDVEGLKIFIT